MITQMNILQVLVVLKAIAFRPDNQETFIKFVHDNTDVCFAGVGGVEGDGDIF